MLLALLRQIIAEDTTKINKLFRTRKNIPLKCHRLENYQVKSEKYTKTIPYKCQ